MTDVYIGLAWTAIVVSAFAFFLYRNAWTYRVRTDILAADYEAGRTLPSYEAMLYRFWVWDASWFLGRGEDEDTRIAREAEEAKRRGRMILDKRKAPR